MIVLVFVLLHELRILRRVDVVDEKSRLDSVKNPFQTVFGDIIERVRASGVVLRCMNTSHRVLISGGSLSSGIALMDARTLSFAAFALIFARSDEEMLSPVCLYRSS
jgi:hypothetical protein